MVHSLPQQVSGAEVVYSWNTNDKNIALTFDDGPSGRYTRQLLDGLRDRGVKATFFPIGENVKAHPELVKMAALQGHEIGNHTYTHPYLAKISDKEVEEEAY